MGNYHPDDYEQLFNKHDHCTGRINDMLVTLQDEAYALGRKRGQADAASVLAANPAPAPGWQPIETAPKDGSTIMLWEMYESEPFFGYWWEGRSRWRASTTHYDTDGNACVIDRIYSEGVTHWMPLPEAPGQGKENNHD